MKRTHFTIENYKCSECGSVFPIPRKCGKKRGKDHVKDLWCAKCNKTMKFRRVCK